MKTRLRHPRAWLVLVALLILVACAKQPPNITPEARRASAADVVQTNIGRFGDAIINAEADKAISTEDARTFIQWARDTVASLKVAPESWQAVAIKGWVNLVRPRLCRYKDLAFWVPTISDVIGTPVDNRLCPAS